MHWIDATIIVLSLLVTITIGLWFARKWRDSDDYFLAGRKLPWPLIGFSLFATKSRPSTSSASPKEGMRRDS